MRRPRNAPSVTSYRTQAARDRLVSAEIAEGDTLTNPAFTDKRFRAIVANPPFSVKWDPTAIAVDNPIFKDAPCLPPPSKADYAFLLHIIHCLADDGVAAVVSFPGVCYRGQREGKLRQWLIERNLIDQVISIESGHFVDTNIATVILVLRKDRTSTSIRMRYNALDIERDVTLEEIAENGWSLSVNSYVQPQEPERPPVDPWELEKKSREMTLKSLKASIRMSMMAARLGGWDIMPFIESIRDVAMEATIEHIKYLA